MLERERVKRLEEGEVNKNTERERDGERQTDIETETERNTEIKIQRETDRERQRETDRQTDRQRQREGRWMLPANTLHSATATFCLTRRLRLPLVLYQKILPLRRHECICVSLNGQVWPSGYNFGLEWKLGCGLKSSVFALVFAF